MNEAFENLLMKMKHLTTQDSKWKILMKSLKKGADENVLAQSEDVNEAFENCDKEI